MLRIEVDLSVPLRDSNDQIMIAVWEANGRNTTKAAKSLKVSARHLRARLRKLGYKWHCDEKGCRHVLEGEENQT